METVSVVIPVYNVEPYIQTTIQSVLDQTFPIHEIIVVNDASPDNSMAVCEQFHDPRIITINQENRGPSGALNSGIRRATGDYIALLDGDDVWHPRKIQTHIEHLNTSPTVGVSFSCSTFIDTKGNALKGRQSPQLDHIDIFYLMRYNPLGNGSATVYRRAVFEAIQFQQNVRGEWETSYFDEELRRSQDIELLRRIVLKTPWVVAGLADVLTFYRINPQGLASNFDKKMEVWEQLFAKTCSLNSEVVAPLRAISKAYELKYLARRAVRLRDGESAMRLLKQTMQADWKILLEEPITVLKVMMASLALWAMPRSLYIQLETRFMT